MTLEQLKQRIQSEGYGPLVSESGPRLLSIADLRLSQEDGRWIVCDTEKGENVHTHLDTADEAAACACWHGIVAGTMLLLAVSKRRDDAEAWERALAAAGVAAWRNDIPNFNGPGDPRFRMFVAGRDLLRARQVIGA